MSRRERAVYLLLLAACAGTLGLCLAWWFQPTHLPANFGGHWRPIDVLLFAALTLVIAHRIYMDAFTWATSWGIEPTTSAPAPPEGLRVAFITTFVPSSEPLDLLGRTLRAMLEVDYPHDTWVLDEGEDPAVHTLCASLGVHYFSRRNVRRYNVVAGPFSRRTKGGNHNAWYDAAGHAYDVVAQVDTDFAPRRDFLTRTLGHFRDERVAFVGTPQVYGNAAQSFVARGASQQLHTFYGAIMRGLSGRSMCTMIGANHVVRVAALREVGYYVGHLTEDLITGMHLHSRGWTSKYVPEPLAIGEGPATWQAYFNQQMRWAFGCMDILKNRTLPLLRTMPWNRRLLYFSLQQHYFNGLAMMTGVTLLAMYFFAGIHSADMRLIDMIVWAAPLLLVRQLTTLWLQRFDSGGSERGMLWHGRIVSVVVWPIYFLAAIGVIRQRRLVFQVTPKGARQDVHHTPLQAVWPQAVVGAVSLACVVTGVLVDRRSGPLLMWAGFNAAAMLSFVAGVVLDPYRQARKARRAKRISTASMALPHVAGPGIVTAGSRAMATVAAGAQAE